MPLPRVAPLNASGELPPAQPGTGIPRWLEVPAAALGLVAGSPVFLLLAAAVALTSGLPVLFRQARVGRHGKAFILLKFRTMDNGRSGAGVTARGDARVTPMGRLLRKTKLDELPELWNILCGDMSFVGPRPEVPRYVDLKNPLWQKVLQVRPGLTDPVTLSLRNEEELLATADDLESYYRQVLQPYKLHGYWSYLAQRSARTDIGVLVRTAAAVLLPGTKAGPSAEEIRKTGGLVNHGGPVQW